MPPFKIPSGFLFNEKNILSGVEISFNAHIFRHKNQIVSLLFKAILIAMENAYLYVDSSKDHRMVHFWISKY